LLERKTKDEVALKAISICLRQLKPGCAFRAVRKAAREKALLQMGRSIPVFAFTLADKRLLLNRALHFPGALVHAPIHPAPGAGG